MISNSRPKVLVIPLDWGLGHATRCIPVIDVLLSKGCMVEIAAEGLQKVLLQEQFPNLTIIEVTGYRIKYSKKWLFFHLMLQSVKVAKAIKKEQLWLRETIKNRNIDWVIADNRYGCYSKEIICTIITHQLRVKMPPALYLLEANLQKILYRYIRHFTNCWVPDVAELTRGLSGGLGHTLKKPTVPVWYVGWLSRFVHSAAPTNSNYRCIILLSGPEPLRSILEEKIVAQLKNRSERMVLVRGLPAGGKDLHLPKNVEVYNHLPASQLQKKIEESNFLISRSGYSTLMDAFTLQKKCILIPTPGQTEQEYLAELLQNQQMAIAFKQSEFDLESALVSAEKHVFTLPQNSQNNLLEYAIDNVLLRHFSASQIEL